MRPARDSEEEAGPRTAGRRPTPGVRPLRPAVRLGAALVVLALVGAGCMAHRATDTLLAAADEAVRANLRADEELEAALERHGGQQQQALRDAFLADFRRLSEQNNGAVSYDDLVEGTHLYDQRLGELLASRDSLRQLFEAKRRAQAAALDLILKARDLTAGEIQQYESLDEILRQIGQAAGQAFPQGGGSSPAPSSGAGEAK